MKPDLPPGWFDRPTAAAIFGVKLRQFDATYRTMAPPDAIRTIGRVHYYHVRSIIDSLIAERVKAAKAAAQPAADSGDPMMAGGSDSPNLERYRAARAGLAEIELSIRRREVVNIVDLKTWDMLWASAIRSGGEQIQREFGPRGADIFNEALQEATNITDRKFDDLMGHKNGKD